MTVAQLKTRTAKDLAVLAKRKGIAGWHAMRKEELIQALAKIIRTEASHAKKAGANGHSASAVNGKTPPLKKGVKVATNGHAPGKAKPRNERRLHQIKAQMTQLKDLSHATSRENGHAELKDRLVAMVRDSFWLHAYWELTRASIERARAALGQNWYGARPILRVLEVTRDGTTSSVRKVVRDIEIHGGVNNWYVNVDSPPRNFQMEIGYLAIDGKFVSLAKSNAVATPPAGTVKGVTANWVGTTEDYDRIYALSGGYSSDEDHSDLKELFEERLRRPMGPPAATRFGLGAGGISPHNGKRDFSFQVDAELVVFGVTEPDAHVTLRGEPVRLMPDGTFSMRFNLPDRRQVLPVVASSPDGVEQRTIVLAVERNTKVMEPVTREPEA